MFVVARREGYSDRMRASFYCEHGNIKRQRTGRTAKRWRPKIKAFCEFAGHSDLARMTADDVYRWVDHLDQVRTIGKKSIKDVWIASLSATAGFMVERRKLAQNPFAGVRVRGTDREMTKGDYRRVIPVHSRLIAQGFLDFVERRRKSRLPLFYDPARNRGGTNANPQWQKVAERLADWVRDSLHVRGVKPIIDGGTASSRSRARCICIRRSSSS